LKSLDKSKPLPFLTQRDHLNDEESDEENKVNRFNIPLPMPNSARPSKGNKGAN